MKTLTFKMHLGLFVLVCLMLFSCGKTNGNGEGKAAAEQKDSPKVKEEITAVTENAYPPLNFADKNGNGIGFEYDLTNEIAKRLGRKVRWNLAGWDVMIQSVRQGMYDVGMDGIAVTEERKEQVDFSIPYLTIKQIMLVRADEKRFKTGAEFVAVPEAKIAAQTGTTNFYVAVDLLKTTPENPGNRIVLFENYGAAIQALLAGDADMVILDDISAQGYEKSTGGRVKAIKEDVLSQEEIAYIFAKDSPLTAEFNTAIEALQKDGTIDQLLQKWFVQFEEQKSK